MRGRELESRLTRAEQTEILCSDLSQCLHAVAQPLGILRMGLEREHIAGMDEAELKKLVTSAEAQVERLCSLFSGMQARVDVETRPTLIATRVFPLLMEATDGLQLLFESDGISLHTESSDDLEQVLTDRLRAHTALTMILLAVHKISRPGDSVRVTASDCCTGRVQISIENMNADLEFMSADMDLKRALAEALVRSQEADFSYSAKPFCVKIAFRKVPAVSLQL